ncbi:MAG: 5'/3'-nucleotidase SurE [Chlamydiales bacterium]
MKKYTILITNDDGIMAPGIMSLAKALDPIANLYVVAPKIEQSGAGTGLTIHKPLFLEEIYWPCGRNVWSVSGKPADCVKIALHSICDVKPDLVVSGINNGTNTGRTIYYSGTVGATIEGLLRDIPGIAFSCCKKKGPPQYEVATFAIQSIVSHCLETPLPQNTLLNVNIPSCPYNEIQGITLARQGRQFLAENPDKRIHPVGGNPYFWLGLRQQNFEECKESDVYLLAQNYITVVPIDLSELTHQSYYHEWKNKFDSLFSPLTQKTLN